MYSFLKLEIPRHRTGLQSQNIFATFRWLKVLQCFILVVQLTVTETHPRMSDNVDGMYGVVVVDDDDVLRVVVVVSGVVGGVPSLSV